MSLLRVEVRRFTHRRFARVALLLGVALVVLVVGSAAWSSRPVSDAERAAAAQEAARTASGLDLSVERERCLEDQTTERQRTGDATIDFDCDGIREPTAEDFLSRRPFDPASALPGDLLVALPVTLGLAAFALGASAIGAEWAAGTLATLLVVEPRRTRVWAAKAVAVGTVTAAAALALLALALAGCALLTATWGTTDGLDRAVVVDIGWAALRGAVFIVVGALAGYGLAGVLRSTAGAMGAAALVLVGGDVLLAGTGHLRWVASNNVFAWLNGGHEIPTYDCLPTGECVERLVPLTQREGAAYLALALVACLGLFAVTLSRRDVA